MINLLSLHLHLHLHLHLLLISTFLLHLSTTTTSIQPPQQFPSFNIQNKTTTSNSNVASRCSYSITIKTSCSSPSYTRDQISLAFGDTYRNEVYARRIDDPSSRAFERCSTDTYQITGPCMYAICYQYFYRVGSDGWKPEYVKIFEPKYGTATFTYNAFVPSRVWFGFNFCNGNNNGGEGEVMSSAI